MVPTEELPPGSESTSQVTEVFVLPETVAVNVWLCPLVRPTRLGLTVTETPPVDCVVTVIVVVADLVESATDLAVSVTVAGAGTVPGAV